MFTIHSRYHSYQKFTDSDFLKQEYLINKKSVCQIARELGCTHSTLLKYMAKYNIKTSMENSQFFNKSQLAYGKRFYKGRVIDNKKEVEVINKIKDLRCKKYSYWKIAEMLTDMGVPTKNYGGKWHAKTVWQIINRPELLLIFCLIFWLLMLI